MQTFEATPQSDLGNGIHPTALPGVFFISQLPLTDERGFYSEIARIPELNPHLEKPFIVAQTNLSASKTNVIRGFHAENWNKLITPLTGKCLSVLADIRPESPAFGQVLAFNFSPLQMGSIYVPAGVANSFLVLEGDVNYHYLTDALYKDRDKSGDVSLNLFDPDLGVEWPIPRDQMVISTRDTQTKSLKELFPQKHAN